MANVGGSVTGVARVRSLREDYVPKKLYECVSYRKYGSEETITVSLEEFINLIKDVIDNKK